MATSSISLLAPQIFAGENYQIWSVKMQTYLEAFDLWEVVAKDKPIAPLPANPTLEQIKAHTDEKTKKFKAKTLIQNSIADSIFHIIKNCKTTKEAWDKLKLEYQGSDRTKQMQVLNLKRDFESLTMQEDETITKIMEKVLVTLPERFKSKISSLEESRDLSQISLAELMHALQAQEQRRALWLENVTEGPQSQQAQVAYADLQEEKLFDLDKTYNSTVKVGNGGYVDVKRRGTIAIKTNSGQMLEKQYSMEFKTTSASSLIPMERNCFVMERPKNHKVIRVKWVFKIKLNPDGSICKHKARLVVKDMLNSMVLIIRRLLLLWQGMTLSDGLWLQANRTIVPSKEGIVWLETGSPGLGIFICQQRCAMDVLKKFKVQDCKPVSTPMTTNEKLSKDDGSEKIDEGLYRSLISSILYLTASKPNILFVVSVLSKFMHSPKGDLKLLSYSNSDWGGCVDYSRSISREVQQSNEVLLVHCSSENQLVDIFTKPLPMVRFEALKKKIGVCHLNAKEECSVVGIPDSKP
ncbi:Retrovirus-related Pol polyprotein from transposon RE2 [Vitis vinifera]|uniref:Retrovirus-related Pol polyprotein from transposon RE2 n=1 Tax=Vitis vinifera TaxID=29760 RepID=A0A438FRF0_VITVI|nr:Retrovirus-related Pol polyprotein from transposon RE2 [Vitis vinifera]